MAAAETQSGCGCVSIESSAAAVAGRIVGVGGWVELGQCSLKELDCLQRFVRKKRVRHLPQHKMRLAGDSTKV